MNNSDLDNALTPIQQLKNLGEKSALWLAQVQISNRQDLQQAGSIQAFLRLEALQDFKPSLNFLYAMEAALQGIHWAEIDQQEKARLLISLEDAREHQNMFKKSDYETLDSEKVDPEKVIKQTEKWVNSFIIKYDICPFAEHVVVNQAIAYYVIEHSDTEECLIQLIQHLIKLEADDVIETALLIFTSAVDNFDNYLEFLAIANQLIEDQGFAEDFQLASFHPDYCFEGEAEHDAANFTNRSPWPMLHLIRQSSIEKGLQFYPHPEQIPIRNIKLTRELGYDFLTALTEDCKR